MCFEYEDLTEEINVLFYDMNLMIGQSPCLFYDVSLIHRFGKNYMCCLEYESDDRIELLFVLQLCFDYVDFAKNGMCCFTLMSLLIG